MTSFRILVQMVNEVGREVCECLVQQNAAGSWDVISLDDRRYSVTRTSLVDAVDYAQRTVRAIEAKKLEHAANMVKGAKR